MNKYIVCFLLPLFFLIFSQSVFSQDAVESNVSNNRKVAVIDMEMGIFPGTEDFFTQSIVQAQEQGAVAIVVTLDTPGGMLQTSHNMVKAIFDSPIPVFIHVGPSGATATSAGVFITLAGHVASMAPGTTIGAAHPVSGKGQDIEGDMRAKVENMTVAMVESISEQRGRNVEWAKSSVKESTSITSKKALELGVVDIEAETIRDLLKQAAGRTVSLKSKQVILEDFSELERISFEPSFKQEVLNVLSNPNIAALLWVGASTGLGIELYKPGMIFPGVVGVICLLLALTVYQIIPVTASGVLLLVLGVVLIGAELLVPSGILGIGGLISLVLGAIYLVDVSQAPDLAVNVKYVGGAAMLCGGLMLAAVYSVIQAMAQKVTTGFEGLIGQTAEVKSGFDGTDEGKVYLNGEIWKAVLESSDSAENTRTLVKKGDELEVIENIDSLTVKVRKR